jgi:glycosyltransferase involved in cell wall biosynthesis
MMIKKSFLFAFTMLLFCGTLMSQSRFSTHEISINGFRNPSIGAEYRYKHVSVHAGYYLTNFESNTTWKFVKIGTSVWFLPVGKRKNPSSFYAQFSYLRGLNRDYKGQNAFVVETGFRAMVWKGLQFRLGVAALSAKDKQLRINPTPSINYSFFF